MILASMVSSRCGGRVGTSSRDSEDDKKERTATGQDGRQRSMVKRWFGFFRKGALPIMASFQVHCIPTVVHHDVRHLSRSIAHAKKTHAHTPG